MTFEELTEENEAPPHDGPAIEPEPIRGEKERKAGEQPRDCAIYFCVQVRRLDESDVRWRDPSRLGKWVAPAGDPSRPPTLSMLERAWRRLGPMRLTRP